MERCPKCHRFGIEYKGNGIWMCIWLGCLYKTFNHNDIVNAKHPIRFKKFAKAIKRKTQIG